MSDWRVGGIALLTVVLWGANNTAIRYCVGWWPPTLFGCLRFLLGGVLMWVILRGTDWLGPDAPLGRESCRVIWRKAAPAMAVFVLAFTWGMRFTSASNVVLYLGASPIWALVADIWEGERRELGRRLVAALLACAGVLVLFLPNLSVGGDRWVGDVLALVASVAWMQYGRASRSLHSGDASGMVTTAHAMMRTGILLAPFAAVEAWMRWPIRLSGGSVLAFSYTTVVGVAFCFALWGTALRYWPTSRVYLFSNLIPLTTTLCASAFLGEPIGWRFWPAMILVVGGVLLGQLPAAHAAGRRGGE